MDDAAISTILKYVDEKLVEPDLKWPKDAFKKRTYARWAAYEIIQRLMDRPFEMPDIIVYDYMIKMSVFSYFDDNEERKNMFKIASKTAEDILNLFVY